MSSKINLPLQVINKVSLFNDHEQALLYLNKLIHTGNPCILSFINAHAYNLCFKEIEFAKALLQSDLVLRDGYGMEVLYKSIQVSPGANLNGTDFIPLLLNAFLEKKIALLGTEDPYLNRAAKLLTDNGHNVVLKKDGFLSFEQYLPLLKSAIPDIIILGMRMPKQEKVSILLKANLAHPCIIINGGAIIDFWGGKFKRAPIWMRDLNAEWVFRFMLEPKRLMRRYVIGNYLFLKRIKKLRNQLEEIVVLSSKE